jgi:hypothetical protein
MADTPATNEQLVILLAKLEEIRLVLVDISQAL